MLGKWAQVILTSMTIPPCWWPFCLHIHVINCSLVQWCKNWPSLGSTARNMRLRPSFQVTNVLELGQQQSSCDKSVLKKRGRTESTPNLHSQAGAAATAARPERGCPGARAKDHCGALPRLQTPLSSTVSRVIQSACFAVP